MATGAHEIAGLECPLHIVLEIKFAAWAGSTSRCMNKKGRLLATACRARNYGKASNESSRMRPVRRGSDPARFLLAKPFPY
ncbi:MAG: hypothetical protein AAGL68_08745, partial [Pseudomonadota bacterium]